MSKPRRDSTLYNVRLLGTPRIEGPEGVLRGPTSQRHRIALLALLARAPEHVMAREKLIGFLWPETDGSAARQLLSVGVHAIRKALGESVLRSEGDSVRLDPTSLRIDAIGFQASAEERKLARAASLYSGVFLDGFGLPNAVDFEYWLDTERDRLEQQYLVVLRQLADGFALAGDTAKEVEWLRTLVSRAPADGVVVCRLMEALDRIGDRGGALHAAKNHAAFLAEEFDSQPDPRVAALSDRLRGGELPIERHGGVVITPSSGSITVLADAQTTGRPDGLGHSADTGRQSAVQAIAGRQRGRRLIPFSRRITLLIGVTGAAMVTTIVVAMTHEKTRAALPTPIAGDHGASRCAADAVVPFLHREPGLASIAVLPFTGGETAGTTRLFVQGSQNQVLTQLTSIESLRVFGAVTTGLYDDCGKPPIAIGRELGATAVLIGHVTQPANRVRLSLSLINVNDGRTLWAYDHERDLTGAGLLEIHEGIGQQVANALRVRLSPREEAQLRGRREVGSKAYEHYLLGELYHRRLDLSKAVSEFETAVSLDSGFALAWAGLSQARSLAWFVGGGPERLGNEAKAALERARLLDPNAAETHVAAGLVHLYLSEDYDAAYAFLDLAHQLRPSDPAILYYKGVVRTWQERFQDAISFHEAGIRYDPVDVQNLRALGWLHAYEWRFLEAKKYLELAARIAPEDAYLFTFRFDVLTIGFADTLGARQLLSEVPYSVTADPYLAALAAYRRDPGALQRTLNRAELWAGERFEWLSRMHRMTGRRQLTSVYADSMAEALAGSLASLDRVNSYPLWRATLRSRLAVAHALKGDSVRAVSLIEEALRDLSNSRDRLNGPLVLIDELRVYSILGRADEAAPRMERLFQRRDRGGMRNRNISPHSVRLDPDYDGIRADSSVRRILSKFY